MISLHVKFTTTKATFKDGSNGHSKTVVELSLKPTTIKVLTNDDSYVKNHLKKCGSSKTVLSLEPS